jgi:Rieske Fe-S protein
VNLDRREFLVACAGCALAWKAAGCAAIHPVPLLGADAGGKLSITGQLKGKLPDSPDLVLVWVGKKGLGAASIGCTLRGSEVHFNLADGTLDCPSHGSRFDQNGKVLEGPARRQLVSYRVQVEDCLLSLHRT